MPTANVHWLVLIAVLIGHFGIHLAIYNRVNAIGWSRRTTKRISKFFFLTMLTLPVVIGGLYFSELLAWLSEGSSHWSRLFSLPVFPMAYFIVCLASWMLLGVPWLLWRPILGLEWVRASRTIQSISVDQAVATPLALSRKCKLESQLPFNQLFDLSVEEIKLPVVGLPAQLDGYRIAHLSDIHLTGDVHLNYAKFTVETATRWKPELMVLSGDIIDSQKCIQWLTEIYSGADAIDGCYYVLGNHDVRITDSRQTRRAMDHAGWTDLGCLQTVVHLRGVPVRLIGNEYPWFDRPELPVKTDEEFRMLLSHSPDQIWWARKHGIQLMFAGHTHGGQGRLPLFGPLLSPSYHGSRFASGDFYKPPTTMHVSRGLGGTHLVRINCRPELSLITLCVG
ncbi:phosphodiesterase YaeI [Novipirellula aureliae]|uniref:Phosphodiesterase YaeI n=1 Tax=Novipirellula aureliae TaxID=2527966 RepID=A0A5C6DLU1_9BACT|nr:metallophosphoesterase [Novipirellula aureliae]TWU36601.1 phosphodiesterase YaeI [Novipirellula aureliae]